MQKNTKLTLATAIISALAIGATGYYCYRNLNNYIEEQLDKFKNVIHEIYNLPSSEYLPKAYNIEFIRR